jgi:hypothetical protein
VCPKKKIATFRNLTLSFSHKRLNIKVSDKRATELLFHCTVAATEIDKNYKFSESDCSGRNVRGVYILCCSIPDRDKFPVLVFFVQVLVPATWHFPNAS